MLEASKTKQIIDEYVRGKTAERWNGMVSDIQNEYITLAQREGLQAALKLLDEESCV